MTSHLEISAPLSDRALRYLEAKQERRNETYTCDADALKRLLAMHGLPCSSALLEFEAAFGGLVGFALNFGIFQSLSEHPAGMEAQRVSVQHADCFESGAPTKVAGSGYPRASFAGTPLVPAGMMNEEVLYFITEGGTVYRYFPYQDQLFADAGNARTLIERYALYWNTLPGWANPIEGSPGATLVVDVAESVANAFGARRADEICDHIYEYWIGQNVVIELDHGVPPNRLGTSIYANDGEILVRAVLAGRDAAPDAMLEHRGDTTGAAALSAAGIDYKIPPPPRLPPPQLGIELSARAMAQLESAQAQRIWDYTCSDNDLRDLLAQYGLTPSPAQLELERSVGGFISEWDAGKLLPPMALGFFQALSPVPADLALRQALEDNSTLFEISNDPPPANPLKLRGGGFPRLLWGDRVLVPAGMKNEYFWYLVDEEGALYEFAVEDEQIISAAANVRTLLESCAVLGALTSAVYAEATLSADVASELVQHLGLTRVEEASDRVREFWLGEAGGVIRIRELSGSGVKTLICVRDGETLVQTVRLALTLAPSASIEHNFYGRHGYESLKAAQIESVPYP